MPEQEPRPRCVAELKMCGAEECYEPALSFRDRCWRHLSGEERIEFRSTVVEKALSQGLSGAYLREVDLRNTDLSGSNLKNAILTWADLRGANLSRANLQRADFQMAKLQGADLTDTDLRGAQLSHSDLSKAILTKADLRHADLVEADLGEATLIQTNLQEADLAHANLQKADLEEAQLQKSRLHGSKLQQANLRFAYLQDAELIGTVLEGARLQGVVWRGAQYLTANQIGETGDYVAKEWIAAEDAYRRLKNYFHEEGRYHDESWAFVMEKTCVRELARLKGRFRSEHASLWTWWKIANYGEDWKRAARLAAFIILFFAILYYPTSWGRIALEGHCPLDPTNPVRSLYFSVVTFATLGFGDIRPANTWGALAVIVEVLLGYFMLGVTVALVARKMTR